MKVLRLKKASKILTFYSTSFGYREPFQILVDGTFCQSALENKVAIEEQLQKYLQHGIKLVTTQCIILEAESLGPVLTGATKILKKFVVHKCGHEGKPVAAINCVKSMVKESRYIVATQDRHLQNFLRKQSGQAILYLHRQAPILEQPSESSKNEIKKRSTIKLSKIEGQKVEKLKVKEGVDLNKTRNTTTGKRKHKNPNPLSCKKRKKEERVNKNSTDSSAQKARRKKLKMLKCSKGISSQQVFVDKLQ